MLSQPMATEPNAANQLSYTAFPSEKGSFGAQKQAQKPSIFAQK
jgi:hypothetical protein